jgi:hypothetical protein
MTCPRCGAPSAATMHRSTLSGPGIVVCFRCGYRGIGGRPTINPVREVATFIGIQWIYLKHGLAVWLLASVALFFVWVRTPLTAVTQESTTVPYILMALGFSAVLGSAIGLSVFLGGWLFPRVKVIHVVFPLSVAAAIGALHGYWIENLIPAAVGIEPLLRPQTLRTLSGAGLAMLATPIIIVRSSKMGAKKGLRPPVETSPRSGDSRSDS